MIGLLHTEFAQELAIILTESLNGPLMPVPKDPEPPARAKMRSFVPNYLSLYVGSPPLWPSSAAAITAAAKRETRKKEGAKISHRCKIVQRLAPVRSRIGDIVRSA